MDKVQRITAVIQKLQSSSYLARQSNAMTRTSCRDAPAVRHISWRNVLWWVHVCRRISISKLL